MQNDEAIRILESITNPEDFSRLLDFLSYERILRLERLGYLKEIYTQITKEEFKEHRKTNEDKYRYFSKNFNFCVQKTGTRYYRRDYLHK